MALDAVRRVGVQVLLALTADASVAHFLHALLHFLQSESARFAFAQVALGGIVSANVVQFRNLCGSDVLDRQRNISARLDAVLYYADSNGCTYHSR